MSKPLPLRNERGLATFIALILMIMLTLVGLAALKLADDEISIAGNEMNEMTCFYAAEAGLEVASAALQTDYETSITPGQTLPAGVQSLNTDATVAYVTTDNGAATMDKLTYGTMAGLHALVKTYTITSIGTSLTDGSQVTLEQEFECALVPIFQFAVFYANDLWTTPAKDMTVTGRVHVNGNMYLQASQSLNFNGKVTASGDIHHGFPSWSGVGLVGGDVNFKAGDGSLVSMNQGGSWLDASDSYWYDSASTRWGGNVRDQAFGQEELNVPLTTAGGDAHLLIERGSGNPDSYEHKATFKIIDGIPYTQIGSIWQDVSALLPAGTITSTSFYDDREDVWVNSTDVNMALLQTSSYFPSNGVLYASDQRSGFNAARLVNGDDVGHPISIFCENPVYVKGDFNTVDKQPAAIVADAVNFLSNDWQDSNSNKSLRTYRKVYSQTVVNASIISGDCVPTSSSYGGGLANLPRFLEHWNSAKFTLNGSMVNLWRSTQATGKWLYGGWNEYYTAPTRDYRFDTDLEDPAKLPPETPVVRSFGRTGWKQTNVGYAST